ncbi:MAG: dTMP kinase [Clostridia bacterium]
MKRGMFITVEGTDGSGKSTQIEMMKDYINNKGIDVVLTREPGGTTISEKIRSIILDPENTKMADMTELLLYAASRAQLVDEIIRPAIEQGKTVIADRFIDSSYVYQGFGRGMGIEIIETVNKTAVDGILPNLTLFFDISPEIALERRTKLSGPDRIEKEEMDFHMRVYKGYKKLASDNPQRIVTIDSNRGVEAIAADVRKIIDAVI